MTRAEKLEYIELLEEKQRRKVADYPNQFKAGNCIVHGEIIENSNFARSEINRLREEIQNLETVNEAENGLSY